MAHCINLYVCNNIEGLEQNLQKNKFRYLKNGDYIVMLGKFRIKKQLHSFGVPAVVYVTTEYFGGGEQSSTVYDLITRQSTYSDSINQGLAMIGILGTKEMDAYDRVGLGKYRSNYDFIELSKQQAKESRKQKTTV
jgi:hypothetical protein